MEEDGDDPGGGDLPSPPPIASEAATNRGCKRSKPMLNNDNNSGGSLVLVAALWGCTNPFIRRGTKGLRNVKSDTFWGQFCAEVTYLLGNWKYIAPWLINQCGSLVYLVTLQSSHLSLAVPVSNSLAFVFTALTGWWVGEEALTAKSMLGVLLIIAGTIMCYVDKV